MLAQGACILAALGSRPRGAAEIAEAGIWLMEVSGRWSLATVYWFVQKGTN